uniref:RING-type domain-containing protein n=1 Tax=Glossina palpalis gambiensis TaxID=67801 RepID=A0A1B0BAV8_9MUSC
MPKIIAAAMPLAPAIFCPKCAKNFAKDDEVRSTRCGHVFHSDCVQDLRTRSTQCPICQIDCQNIQILFLEFDDNETDVIKELQTKIKTSKDNFVSLQEQYTIAKSEIDQLNDKISANRNYKKNLLSLQNQYEEAVKINKESNQENERLFEQAEAKQNEISSLKNIIKGVGAAATCPDLSMKHKAKTLERKLELITNELHKEISNSTQLSIDNMKLQCLIDQCGATKVEPSKKPIDIAAKQKEKQKENVIKNPKEKLISKNLRSALIRYFPSKYVRHPLKYVVLGLASAMKFELSADDISFVRLYENHDVNQRLPSKVTLQVQFKNGNIKNIFLQNKSTLVNHPKYGSILISEYIDDDTNSLLNYAKEKLEGCGSFKICYYKSKVIITAGDKGSPPMYLENRAQVDELLRSKTERVENLKSSTNMLRR